MPVFFITDDQVQNGVVTITGPLLNHLHESLRIRSGDTITVTDQRRHRYVVEVQEIDRARLCGRVQQTFAGPAPCHPAIVLGQALLKSDRMEWIIQKATELGVSRIVPLLSTRTVVRPRADRIASQQERWQRIALEAAQQAERWDVPVIQSPCDATAFFAGQDSVVKLLLRERDSGVSLRTADLPSGPHAAISIAIGPEGGWTGEELERAAAAKFQPVTLGERILRAETAALAAVTILQSRVGELG